MNKVQSDGTCALCSKKADNEVMCCFACEQTWHVVGCNGDDLATESFRKQFQAWKVAGSYRSIVFLCPPCRDSKNLQRETVNSNRMSVIEDRVASVQDDLKQIKDALTRPPQEQGEPSVFPRLQPSYADKVKSSDCVIVIKKGENDEAASRSIINDAAVSSKVGVSSSRENKRGDTVLVVENEAAKTRLAANLREKLTTHDITTPASRMPTIRVTGMEQNFSAEQVFNYARDLNEDKGIQINESDFKVLFIRPHFKNPAWFQATVRVSNEVRAAIERAGDKLHIGLKRCLVYDHFHIRRCNHCQGYNHYKDKCNNTAVCGKCAGPHETETCRSEEKKCANCSNNNFTDTNHEASDPICQSYKNAQKKLEQSIGYYKGKN